MVEILYSADAPMTPTSKSHLRTACREVFPDNPATFTRVESGGVVVRPKMWDGHPAGDRFVVASMTRWAECPVPEILKNALFLDIETHNAGKQWDMPIEEFFRLGQFSWGFGPITLTTDLDVVLDAIDKAPVVVAHNGHSFDFSVLLGDKALDMAVENRLLDTMVYANLVIPAPYSYTDRAGHTYKDAAAPERAKKWLSLDNLCYQIGVGGKEGDLRALAKKYNPKGTKVADYDYGLIPLDDPDFLAYAEQDIVSLRDLTVNLFYMHEPTEYDWRNQLTAAIDAQMTRNGIAVDVALAQERVAQAQAAKDELLGQLQEQYGFPTAGAMPWRSKPGKEAIFRILSDNDITPQSRPNWTKTATGNLSLGGEVLVEITKDTPAEGLGESLAILQGQRPLAQQALTYTRSDGRVHPDIGGLQRSGRRSVTKPGMTTWSQRDKSKRGEKDYIIASPGHVLLEFDLSNADQRIVAAMSGDKEYLKRFDEGVDGHEINGRIMFGDEVYDSDPHRYRDQAKAPGHAYTYGAGPRRLSITTGLPLETMERFVEGMQRAYPKVTRWQMNVREEGESGWVTNAWGRRMVIDVSWENGERKTRAWTQAPALHGQSGTTEVLYDGLIKMLKTDRRLIQWLVCPVHDAIVMDVPESEVDYVRQVVPECMEQTINGVPFPVASGPAGKTWSGASH